MSDASNLGPDLRTLISVEGVALLSSAADPSRHGLATICAPWTVLDIVRHVAATAERFVQCHRRAVAGDLAAPFDRAKLSDENLRAVSEFDGDPFLATERWIREWVTEAVNDDQLVGHQLGPQPLSRLNLFLLNDIVMHHFDVMTAVGIEYSPSADVLVAQAAMWKTFDVSIPDGPTRWAALITASGR
jgi:uncharacterized protein (TIGR03083 family)